MIIRGVFPVPLLGAGVWWGFPEPLDELCRVFRRSAREPVIGH
jgi:hypothetical protein